jgi:hypothetical protein
MICNTAILGALQCAAEAGAGGEVTCLTKAIEGNTSDPPALGLGTCLSTNSGSCGGPVVEGGTDAPAGDASDGGSTTDAGDGGSTTDAGDGGSTTDASDSGSTTDAGDGGDAG